MYVYMCVCESVRWFYCSRSGLQQRLPAGVYKSGWLRRLWQCSTTSSGTDWWDTLRAKAGHPGDVTECRWNDKHTQFPPPWAKARLLVELENCTPLLKLVFKLCRLKTNINIPVGLAVKWYKQSLLQCKWSPLSLHFPTHKVSADLNDADPDFGRKSRNKLGYYRVWLKWRRHCLRDQGECGKRSKKGWWELIPGVHSWSRVGFLIVFFFFKVGGGF